MEAQQGLVEGFFTGLSRENGTRPGFAVSNDKFSVRFEGIQVENLSSDIQRRFVKEKFESSYNWDQVMETILECLEYYYYEGDFQIDCQMNKCGTNIY